MKVTRTPSPGLVATVCWLLILQPIIRSQTPQVQYAAPFQLAFESGGDGTVNQLRGGRPVDVVFQVLDAKGTPVAGADVTISTPLVGATLQFPGGQRTTTVRTDNDGRVRLVGLIPIGSGPVNIRIQVSHAGAQMIDRTIKHSNVRPPLMTPAKWTAVAAGVAAVAGGLSIYYTQRDTGGPTRITQGPGSVTPAR